jgi:hypothetical protein
MNMRKVKAVLPVLVGILLCLSGQEARADLYKYKDGKGIVCITDKLESVPVKYRGSMQVLADDSRGRKEQAAQSQSAPGRAVSAEQPAVKSGEQAVAPASAGSLGESAASRPWVKPLTIAVGVLVAFFLVVKISAALPSRQFGRLIYLAFFLGIFVFAYKSYAEHVTSSYLGIKSKILTMFKKANEREGLNPENKGPNPEIKGLDLEERGLNTDNKGQNPESKGIDLVSQPSGNR